MSTRWCAVAVVLAACGTGPSSLSVTPAGMTFGSVGVGAIGADVSFTVENLGDSATGVLVVAVDDPQFQIASSTCTGPLAGRASCAVVVHFAPTRRGAIDATLAIAGMPGELASVALTGTGLAPAALAITPTTADFGTVNVVNTSVPVVFTISNSGQVDSGVPTLALAGMNPDSFVIGATTCTTALVAGASCTVSLILTGLAPSGGLGGQSTSLTATAVPGGTASAVLHGQVTSFGYLQISPSSHDFGSVAVGASSAPFAFTITNTSNVVTSPSLDAVLGGIDPADFSLQSTCTTLAPLATCTVTVLFTPQAGGCMRAAGLATSAGGLAAAVSGSAISPAGLAAVPAAKDFGFVATGSTSAPATIAITNESCVAIGGPSLTLTGVNPNAFRLGTSTCTGPLAVGATCTVDVTFAPVGLGSLSAALNVAATPGGTLAIPLTGMSGGVANLSLAPVMKDFGPQLVGASTAPFAFTVTNNGPTPTGMLSSGLSGNDPSQFQIASDTCSAAMLASGQSCTLAIAFAPASTGAKSATFYVGGSPGGTAGGALTGTGATTTLGVSPAMKDFGSLQPGLGTTTTFTITNLGSASSGALTVALAGSSPSQFYLGPSTCSAALAPGSTCTVDVAGAPMGVGNFAGSLVVTGAAAGSVAAPLSEGCCAGGGLYVSPSTHDFGSQTVAGATAAYPFTVTNGGATTTGSISATLIGANAADFQIVSNDCGTLANLATCTISVAFGPTATGARTGTLILSSTPGGLRNALLSGTGL